jgi:translation elongation factor EF-1alpha
MAAKKIGTVIHFYDKIQVAILKLTASLKTGDQIKFKHNEDEFSQTVASMELMHKKIDKAKKGDEVGIKVDRPVKEKTQVLAA